MPYFIECILHIIFKSIYDLRYLNNFKNYFLTDRYTTPTYLGIYCLSCGIAATEKITDLA